MFTSAKVARVSLVIAAFTLGIVLAFLAGTARTSGAERADAADFAAIDRYIEKEMEAARLPGLALAIVKDDRIVHMRGFGEAGPSGRKVTPQTPFVIGSTGKSFTALAIMQLVEEGKVDLDAPVRRYLPWFEAAGPEASSPIRIRHLLNHTSGFSTASGTEYLLKENGSPDALERQVRALKDVELDRPVGSSFEYSNTNYTILGFIVQSVSGEPYERYVEEHIFAPLDMDYSFADYEEAKENGLTQGYRYWFGMPRPADLIYNRAGPGQMLIGSFALVGVLVLQMGAIIRSVVLLRRWRSRPEAAPRGAAQTALRVWVPFAVSLLWALASLIVAPSLLAPGVPFSGLLHMDFGQVLVASGAVALIWGILRLLLVYRRLHRTRVADLVARKESEGSPVGA